MQKSYIIGFPRIGEQRELKKALESYWSGQCSMEQLQSTADMLKSRHWHYQKDAGIDCISSNDFSYYDAMLDTAQMLGAIPRRFAHIKDEKKRYFAMARGSKEAVAMEMTKWFNTNYHYLVPELSLDDRYEIDAQKVLDEYEQALQEGVETKINLIGPITFTALAKRSDGGDAMELLGRIEEAYEQLLARLSTLEKQPLLQIEEPILATDRVAELLHLVKPAYERLCRAAAPCKIAVATYFEHSVEAVKELVETPVHAFALDFIYGKENFKALPAIAQSGKHLIAGVVDGRNIWKNELQGSLELLESIAKEVPKRKLSVSTSCSLLHVPYTLEYETKLDPEIRSWMSYAKEKLQEVSLLKRLFFHESPAQDDLQALENNSALFAQMKRCEKIHDANVQKRMRERDKSQRAGKFAQRIVRQKQRLNYPELATTTIGSFPQTPDIRKVRREYKKGAIAKAEYEAAMKRYIKKAIEVQEEAGLDILVHGEPERNDMVEYFGEMLEGFAFSQNGWVQSYGSRCVKPPVIYGDVSRKRPMTVEWITYAQSLTDRWVKGMLTGPVTILNWSFVRNDLPPSEVSKQIALCISDEVNDLQDGGIGIVQVDEAAFKEGYPLRSKDRKGYERWAVESFRLSVSSAREETQIHTHMCYSNFNDIIHTIEAMDADVISIETARSGNKLLHIFAQTGYKQEIGPGVYDIHSPRIPSVDEMADQIEKLLEVLPKEQLWINPDCGLKTRKWEEVIPSLENMVKATQQVRRKRS